MNDISTNEKCNDLLFCVKIVYLLPKKKIRILRIQLSSTLLILEIFDRDDLATDKIILLSLKADNLELASSYLSFRS